MAWAAAIARETTLELAGLSRNDRRRSGSALERSSDWLVARQYDEGYWVAELEGDTILESEYVLLLAFLGLESDPVCARMARYIRDHQLEDGGWAIYPGGPTDVSASVKAYFALKLVGADPDELLMVRARRAILDAGGAARMQQLHAVLPGAAGPDRL